VEGLVLDPIDHLEVGRIGGEQYRHREQRE
jgi:hypothetical protein